MDRHAKDANIRYQADTNTLDVCRAGGKYHQYQPTKTSLARLVTLLCQLCGRGTGMTLPKETGWIYASWGHGPQTAS